jgi:hypothetical protein
MSEKPILFSEPMVRAILNKVHNVALSMAMNADGLMPHRYAMVLPQSAIDALDAAYEVGGMSLVATRRLPSTRSTSRAARGRRTPGCG